MNGERSGEAVGDEGEDDDSRAEALGGAALADEEVAVVEMALGDPGVDSEMTAATTGDADAGENTLAGPDVAGGRADLDGGGGCGHRA